MSPLAPFKIFQPILPGATLGERLLASLGALLTILAAGLLTGIIGGDEHHLLWLVPPMGASAVLLFVLPASPMSQPWPVIGGNAVSALVGLLVGHALGVSAPTAGLAVGLAIVAMSLTRSLHPPGGAAALVGLFAAPTSSLLFAILPVGLNAAIMVTGAILYHRTRGANYPHKAAAPPAPPKEAARPTFSAADIDDTLNALGETFDISRDDLERLLREIEKRALARAYRDLPCRDLMTRNVLSLSGSVTREEAFEQLARHDFRSLPVLDEHGRVIGVVGQRELAREGALVADLMAPAATAAPDAPALSLIDRFARGRVHAVFMVDAEQRLLGVITEADWLAVLTRGLDIMPKAA